MIDQLKRFHTCEDGAVTVDWVVLTAAIVGLGMGVILTLSNGTTNLATNISSEVGSIVVDNGQTTP